MPEMLKGVETIIFDVDGTLSEEVSWLKLTKGLGASSEKHAAIFERYRRGEIGYADAKSQLLALWQSSGNANRTYMESMFRSWELRKDAQDTIAYLRGKYRICLISGAVDLYVGIVAEKLSVEDWYANTQLVWDEKGNLIDFHYQPDQAAKKLEQFDEFVVKEGIDRDKCIVIGDGDSDMVLFKELKGIAVNRQSHPELEALATIKVSELGDLKEVL